MQALNKKEIREQLEDIKNFLENDAQDDWYIYSNLRDKIEQLEILLKLNDVI